MLPNVLEVPHEYPWFARPIAQVRAGNVAEQDRRQAGASGGGQLGSLLSGAGGGALAAGAIGLLLGNKKARKFGGKAITYGGLAALGVIAYKAQQLAAATERRRAAAAADIDRLPEAQAEVHSHAILQAIVGAAKADGHIDERERQMIEGEVAKLTSDREVQGWLERELNKPLDPAEIARAASTPEIAAEMYLASLLMVDEESFMERSYLEERRGSCAWNPRSSWSWRTRPDRRCSAWPETAERRSADNRRHHGGGVAEGPSRTSRSRWHSSSRKSQTTRRRTERCSSRRVLIQYSRWMLSSAAPVPATDRGYP